MSSFLVPRLINPPEGDPGLYVRLRNESEALLFDLGDNGRLSPRELMKAKHVFVSHTHMDHFVGFDRLLRVRLAHERPLHVYGPRGILANVRGKLAGYTWNHAAQYPFELCVHELGPDRVDCARLTARGGFRAERLGARPFEGLACESDAYRVLATHLDHSIPILAFALEGNRSLNVRPEQLERLGLQTGAWLSQLKRAIREQQPGDTPIRVERRDGVASCERLDRLQSELILERPGEKLAYVVDARFHRQNAERIVELVRGADLFFCEAPFLDAERARAHERNHLTARQAGSLARAAGVRKLVPFHFSRRHSDETDLLWEEAQRAFRGELAPDTPPDPAAGV